MVLQATNTSDTTIAIEPHQFSLLLNDSASVAFMLRMSNGIRQQDWGVLAPGATLQEDLSPLVPRLFTAPGTYRCQLKYSIAPSEVMSVQVKE